MFSSLTSFLPSALQINNNDDSGTNNGSRKGKPPPLSVQNIEQDEEEEQEAEDNKAKKKKEKGANETFIFVRPPPAKNNHPLNLQVQLVPPNTRAPGLPQTAATPRQSMDGDVSQQTPSQADFDAEDPGNNGLTRTTSDVSTYSVGTGHSQTPSSSSYAASTASFSSVASASSTASARRAIIPLYNLQAHNVLTNTIVDAGTDAKIARFTKKGLEMVEMGVLECVEVWALKDKDGVPIVHPAVASIVSAPPRSSSEFQGLRKQASSTSTRGSGFLNPQRAPSINGRPETPEAAHGHRDVTPESSVVSVSSAGLEGGELTQSPPTMLAELPVVSPPKRKLFGKLFSSSKTATPTQASVLGQSQPRQSTTPTPKSPHFLSTPRAPSPAPSSRHSKHLSANFPIRSTQRDRSTSPNPGVPPSPRNSFISAPSENYPQGISMTNSPRASVDGGPPSVSTPTSTSAFAQQQQLILPPTLGIQPTLNSLLPFPFPVAFMTGEKSSAEVSAGLPYKMPRGPAMYVWIMRRWLKPDFLDSSSVLGIQVNFGKGSALFGGKEANGSGSGLSQAEVRLEWKRGKSKAKKRSKTGKKDEDSRRGSRRNSFLAEKREGSRSRSRVSLSLAEDDKRKLSKRLSLLSTSQHSHQTTEDQEGYDSGEESDPEDSETPWTCVLKVKKGLGSAVRLKLGTLSPTPHHPKVVGMLKVPYPLPDVEFEDGGNGPVVLRKRGDQTSSNALTLTAEELKDLLCSTGMWLVVKEGFGGVGRVGRKGDGWRIRA